MNRAPVVKIVFFDYDGVLTTDRTGSLTTCRFISRSCGLPLQAVQRAFAAHNRALTLGHTTHEAAWTGICHALGREVPFGLLRDAFDSTPANHAMFTLARRLRTRCPVGIITDNKSDRIRRLRRTQDLDAIFDPIVVSADVGCSKSSPGLFEHALSLAGATARETVFIDNDVDNVATAAALGIRAVHFDDAVNDVPGLEARLHDEFGLSWQPRTL